MTSIVTEIGNDCLFIEVAENGHIKILELADRKELDWYNREILVGAVARTDLELLDFILNKKPNQVQFELYKNVCQRGFH